ncbi:DeoR/GlpR family DNA-binding transcription regulator [Sphingomonas qilianensis]|uniref:DeoR/GlpR family DNA-binding transcription regulator n=1 Tax=Sphingomonas qilianensis TaxID=1736690 RepID=A0ABU9XNB8_9SPHN
MPNDIPSNRREMILARLSAGHAVRSGALAEEFGLSEDAIRRDLRGLAAEGLCRRVYGGALPVVEGATPMAERVGEDVHRKQALAAAAAQFIESGSFVFLDNGSSTLALVETLPPDLNFTIGTSSITIAAGLQHRDDIDLLMVGGVIDRMVGGAVDGTAIEAILRLNIDLCVLGACALSVEGGVSAFDMADANFKRALVARSRKTIVLATNDKLGQQAPHRILGVDAVTHIVIEHDADVGMVRDLTEAGATIAHADPQGPSGQP